MNLQGAHPSVLRGERRLIWALVASVALHAAALLPPGPAPLARVAAQPLRASLRAAPDAAIEPAGGTSRIPPVPAARAPRPERPARSALPVIAAVPRVPVVAAAVSGVPVVAAVPPSEPAMPHADAAASREAPAPPAATPAANLPAPAAAAQEIEAHGLDPDALRDYRFALARAVTKRYPPGAIERGLSGTAEVRITVSRQGGAREVELRRSSGHALLDAEAKEMVARASARAAVPQPLRGQEFAVDLPVRFDLREAGDW